MNNNSNFDPFQQDGPIPQTLTDNVNVNPFDEQDNPRRRMIVLALSVVAVCGCCAVLVAAYIMFQPGQLSFIQQYLASATATSTQTPTTTPTFTPSPTLTATPTPNATATAQVQNAQATSANITTKWRVVITDAFDSNKNKWLTKPSDDEFGATTYTIADGKYTWDLTAHKAFINWEKTGKKSLGDFYVSMEIKQTEGPDTADYGIVFREDEKSNFYYFGINEKGQYMLYLYNSEWSTLVDFTQSDLIKPGEANRLTVIGEGSHFTFFINDQYLTEITDDTIPKGVTALAVELANENDHGVFEFDNIEVRPP